MSKNCPYCGSEIKEERNSLHIWSIEYECGYTIWGAIDTKTHGNGIEVSYACGKDINIHILNK